MTELGANKYSPGMNRCQDRVQIGGGWGGELMIISLPSSLRPVTWSGF